MYRERGSSLSENDEIGRRRKRDEEDGGEGSDREGHTFKRSTKTKRSPTNDGLAAILKKLDQIQDELGTIKKSNKRMEENNKELKEEFIRYRVQMEQENKLLKDKVEKLESKVLLIEEREEKREKQEKRNNLIISEKLEKEIKENPDELKKHTKEICESLTGMVVNIKSIYHLATNKAGLDIVKVELESFEEKRRVMKNKFKLAQRQERIYIDEDLTRNEANIQRILRERARQEKQRGNSVKIGYKKLLLNGKWVAYEDLEKNE